MVNNKNLPFAKCFLLHLVAFTFSLTACAPSGEHKPVPSAQDSSPAGGAKIGSANVQFADVQGVFSARCTRCHNSGDKNWTDRASAEKWARSGAMARALSTGFMPLKGSPEASAITADERQKIVSWSQSLTASGGTAASPTSVSTQDPAIVSDRNMAFVSKCMGCHGPTGTSPADQFPNLAGHGPHYILDRLNQFLKKDASGIMADTIKSLASEYGQRLTYDESGAAQLSEDFKSLLDRSALFFSLLTTSQSVEDFEKARTSFKDSEKSLYEQGKKIVQERCVACHLKADLRPMENAPMVFGQKASYIQARLAEFKSGKGGNVMPAMIQGLSDQDLKAVEVYLSQTHPAQGKL